MNENNPNANSEATSTPVLSAPRIAHELSGQELSERIIARSNKLWDRMNPSCSLSPEARAEWEVEVAGFNPDIAHQELEWMQYSAIRFALACDKRDVRGMQSSAIDIIAIGLCALNQQSASAILIGNLGVKPSLQITKSPDAANGVIARLREQLATAHGEVARLEQENSVLNNRLMDFEALALQREDVEAFKKSHKLVEELKVTGAKILRLRAAYAEAKRRGGARDEHKAKDKANDLTNDLVERFMRATELLSPGQDRFGNTIVQRAQAVNKRAAASANQDPMGQLRKLLSRLSSDQVRALLASRGITLPEVEAQPEDSDYAHAVEKRAQHVENMVFQLLKDRGVERKPAVTTAVVEQTSDESEQDQELSPQEEEALQAVAEEATV